MPGAARNEKNQPRAVGQQRLSLGFERQAAPRLLGSEAAFDQGDARSRRRHRHRQAQHPPVLKGDARGRRSGSDPLARAFGVELETIDVALARQPGGQ
ncbi:hypothetical protein [Rhizorhabdus histidinilytica]|uniref:hypothetical protein n=1 Tax=Rhizorhabdus histidinilytica TaxID=439228 RepID=UPI0036725739